MPRFRPLLTYAAALVVVFAAAMGIGYVYEHEPERDFVEVVIDRSAAAAPEVEFASGTVTEVRGDSIVVESDLGTFEVPRSSVPVEELRALEALVGFSEGVSVNLGGERTALERVISGLVLIAPEAAP